MTTTYTITCDWKHVHTLAAAVDAARRLPGRGYLGSDGVSDAFGGAYSRVAFEHDGCGGLVRLAHAAERIARDAWDAIHKASRKGDIETARIGVQTALALDALWRCLAETGLVAYEPQRRICGVTDTIQVTGLLWLAGRESEDLPVTAAAARAFAAGAELRAALADHPPTEAQIERFRVANNADAS